MKNSRCEGEICPGWAASLLQGTIHTHLYDSSRGSLVYPAVVGMFLWDGRNTKNLEETLSATGWTWGGGLDPKLHTPELGINPSVLSSRKVTHCTTVLLCVYKIM